MALDELTLICLIFLIGRFRLGVGGRYEGRGVEEKILGFDVTANDVISYGWASKGTKKVAKTNR